MDSWIRGSLLSVDDGDNGETCLDGGGVELSLLPVLNPRAEGGRGIYAPTHNSIPKGPKGQVL